MKSVYIALVAAFAMTGLLCNFRKVMTSPKYGVGVRAKKGDLHCLWYHAVRDPYFWTAFVISGLFYLFLWSTTWGTK